MSISPIRLVAVLSLAACGARPLSLDTLCGAWVDHPQNPLIFPPEGESIIADPTLVTADEAPDRRWHLWAHGLTGIHPYVSDDGVLWRPDGNALFGIGAVRPFVFHRATVWYLYFEQYTDLSVLASHLEVSTSSDLVSWDAPRRVLEPDLDWEGVNTGNPYVTERGAELYLYYSAGAVVLPDTNYPEPKFVGVATGSDPLGPFTKKPEPLLGPSPDEPYRNLGAGSLKLLDDRFSDQLTALENGIYRDTDGHSRSAILVLSSSDGLSWAHACAQPVLAPVATTAARVPTWKSSFVYAFDTVRVGDELRAFYNARDGWVTPGVERIGMSSRALRQ